MVVLILVAFVVNTFRSSEPVYHGRKLRYWVNEVLVETPGFANGALLPTNSESVVAIRAMHADAIPFLLRWLPPSRPQQSGVRRLIDNILSSSPVLQKIEKDCTHWLEHISGPENRPPSEAILSAFGVLGPLGAPAIPELTQIAKQDSDLDPPQGKLGVINYRPIFEPAVDALVAMGPIAVPSLIDVIDHTENPWRKAYYIYRLSQSRPAPLGAIPKLLEWSADSDPRVKVAARDALNRLDPDYRIPSSKPKLPPRARISDAQRS